MNHTIDKILRAAGRRGLTQQALEAACGLPAGRIAKWKAGQGMPSSDQVWTIATELGVDVAYLLDENREPEDP